MVVVVVGVGGSACFQPHPPAGAPCSTNDDCPTSLTCTAGFCVASGAPIDAPLGGDTLGDATIDADLPLPDGDLSCSCAGSALVCPGGMTACPLGCISSTSGARCAQLVASNDVDVTATAGVSTPIAINGSTVIDTDTGAMSGALARGAGTGVL